MKDRVFIAWSGSNKVAIQVKNILEKQYNYVCSIGGNSDNSSRLSSVGDTVIQQIKTCNQAIVIFQNRADGAVSNITPHPKYVHLLLPGTCGYVRLNARGSLGMQTELILPIRWPQDGKIILY